MDDPEDFKTLQDQLKTALVATTRTAGQISSEDLIFQRSLNSEIGTLLDEQSARLLALSSSLLKSAASLAEIESPSLQEVEDVDNNWRGVVDVLDSLLEKADTCLDEYTGVIKRKTPPTDEQSPIKLTKYQPRGNSFRPQNLVKPQLAFQIKPNNSDISPWKPLLTTKPHALIPLAESLGKFTSEEGHQQYDYTKSLSLLVLEPPELHPGDLTKSQRNDQIARWRDEYRHPYETEILELQYPDTVYQRADPIPYKSFASTTATFVDTFQGVLEMLEELKAATEIAVDLEHHDARSYVGLVSLMQISTREKDWIIDTLKPWRQDLQVLNEVFANPKIVKIFHGAYMDIVWLQRDLGLYVTALFDTHHASRALGYPGGSLAYLLKRFINFDADKQYQMADWRMRPLPDEMFFYARADTHFLLYIYDNMRNELVEKSNTNHPEENKIERVLQKSKETSLLRFERQIYDENSGQGSGGWYSLLAKTPALLNNEQFSIFRAVHAWRDQIARKDDDNTSYVMPNQVLFTLAQRAPLDMVSLYGAAHPISHNVKSRATELLEIIKTAKAAGKDGPSMMEILRPKSAAADAKAANPSRTMHAMRISEDPLIQSASSADQGQLRSDESIFWGSAFGSSIWDPSLATFRNNSDLKLATPLPQVSVEITLESSDGLTELPRLLDNQKLPDNLNAMQVEQNRDEVDDDAFIVKTGKKRKAKDLDMTTTESEGLSGEYDMSLNHKGDEQAREKAGTKAERGAQQKANKAARKLGHAGVMDTTLPDDKEKPFDYSKAEAVLNGKAKDVEVHGGKRRKPFDPYAQSSDAPQGKQKKQTERGGKSHTFRS